MIVRMITIRPSGTVQENARRGLLSPRRLAQWLVLLAATAVVAHGCHRGDHGDADLLIRLTAAGSSPAAASP
jgi:hypothetical protein